MVDVPGHLAAEHFRGRFFTYANRAPAGCDESAIKGFVAGPMIGQVRRSLPA